jgi:threonine/homoserine/homoserine lactone efflux protein
MHEFFAVTLFMLLAAMAPGPDFAMVVRNAILYSRRAACFTALGIGAGLGVHTLYSVLGLAVVIAGSATLFGVIKYAGAAYLCYLGVRSIMLDFQG